MFMDIRRYTSKYHSTCMHSEWALIGFTVTGVAIGDRTFAELWHTEFYQNRKAENIFSAFLI